MVDRRSLFVTLTFLGVTILNTSLSHYGIPYAEKDIHSQHAKISTRAPPAPVALSFSPVQRRPLTPSSEGRESIEEALLLLDSRLPKPRVEHPTTFTLSVPSSLPVLRISECPQRYLHTNTHVYGRHHNQVQEFVNALAWSAELGRTFVLGYFRHNHKWMDPRELYDFTLLRRHYCMLYPEEFIQRYKESGPIVGECFGQEFKDTPIGKATRMKCPMRGGVPRHFSTEKGVEIAAKFLPSIKTATSDFLNLSGQFAFFLRPGMEALVRIFGMLLPADDVRVEVDSFRRGVLGGKPYFAVHLRHREGSCQAEMRQLAAFGDQNRLQAQCYMSSHYVKNVIEDSRATGHPIFIASDHQNLTGEARLISDLHAVTYQGKFPTIELGGMKGLATDFFLLVGAQWFAMNQVSSISQNACYARLGRGLGCHGTVPGVIWRYANKTTEWKRE